MKGLLQTFLQIMLYNKVNTQNPFLDALLISLVGYGLSYIQRFDLLASNQDMLYNLTHFFRKPYKIRIHGKNCTSPTSYGEFYISAAYSDGFNALLDYIIKNIDKSEDIKEIKELYSKNNDNQSNAQFIVSQTREFSIDPGIFIKIKNQKEDLEDSAKKNCYQIENISLEIFSYRCTLSELKQYFDKILSNYKISIQTGRANKKFIYSVDKIFLKDDECALNRWREDVYSSNRTFDNLFFEKKREILKKIDFFIENKSWYDEKGIPYNLGIGLHGPPGTGKTSFIKALANRTNRDIVIIPLKLIKTVSQLKAIFYEDTFNRSNEKGSKSFDQKIIV
jgi:DNA replication protein DnaC